MEYLTGKETRVEKAWTKRGIVGLRSELLLKVGERVFNKWSDDQFIAQVVNHVFNVLPKREWHHAEQYIEETIHLAGVEPDEYFYKTIAKMQLMQELLREEVGDE